MPDVIGVSERTFRRFESATHSLRQISGYESCPTLIEGEVLC